MKLKYHVRSECKKKIYVVVDVGYDIPDGGTYYASKKSAQEHINDMNEFREIAYKNPHIITVKINP